MTSFSRDCLAMLGERLAGNQIDRRAFLKAAAALGVVAPAIGTSVAANAAAGEVVLANWGGDSSDAVAKAFGEPFEKETGIRFVVDTTGPQPGKVKVMVESGNVVWDVMDFGFGNVGELSSVGMLEPIDYTIVDKDKVLPGLAQEYGIAGYAYSNVIAYDSARFPDKKPQTWADFFNLKDFPGKRTLNRNMDADLEAALLADGVAPESLYPIDVKRAFDKIGTIKQDTIFWNTGAESQQLLRDGEVTMGQVWSTRAFILGKDTDGQIVTVWNQGIFHTNAWAVPKDNPGGKDAMRLIASMQDPQRQIECFKLVGFGPVNPAAAALVPAELASLNPSDPANLAVQVPQTEARIKWQAENYSKVYEQYLDFISN